MERYLDEYFKNFQPLRDVERGFHALHIHGEWYPHKDAIVREFAQRLATYYPDYIVEYEGTHRASTQYYVTAKMVRKKSGSLNDLI